MPFPNIDPITNSLPPYRSSPTIMGDVSPFACKIYEVFDVLVINAKRRRIAYGLLAMRKELYRIGVRGFQWIDGSFCERIEVQLGRPPDDVDVVTWYLCTNPPTVYPAHLLDQVKCKATYDVHHFMSPLDHHPVTTQQNTIFFHSLFTHRRDDKWKGMLQVPLSHQDDVKAAQILARKML